MNRPAAFAVLLGSFLASTALTEDARGISELFDPAAIARNSCGERGEIRGEPLALIADTAPHADTAPPLFSGLGTLSYPITTRKHEAQAYFDQGLRLMYAFNHGEAMASFEAAQKIDPTCAMCFWGEAIALGPNINYEMSNRAHLAALIAIGRAAKLEQGASAKERALIDAAKARYSADPKATRAALDDAYADAMAKIHAAYPDDADIATLYGEATMDATHPWWTPAGRIPNGRLAGGLRAIEAVLHAHPDHPGAIHYYVHIMEGSAWTKIAEPYAERLAGLMPAAGHIVHMPTHIYFPLGRYKDALAANLAAIAADEKYFALTPAFDANYFGLHAHNIHFGLQSADMAGDGADALALAAKLRDAISDDILHAKFYADVNVAASYFASVRFAAPDDILALPKPSDDLVYLLSMWHYAQGSGYALKGDATTAAKELDTLKAFREGTDMQMLSASHKILPKILTVAERMLRARIAIAEHKWADAIEPLQEAVAVEDDLGWAGDPPWWDNPPRQSLGIVLLRAGQTRAAVDTLRKALIVAPNDGTVLYALRQASEALGDHVAAEEYGRLFDKAWAGPKPPDMDRL